MALEDADLLVVQKAGGGELRKTTVQQLLADVDVNAPDLQAVTDSGNETTNQIISAGVKNKDLDFSLDDAEGYHLQTDGRLFFQIKNSRGSGWSIVESYRGTNKRFDISGNGRITGGQNLQNSGTKVTNYEIAPNGSATFAGQITAAQGYALAQLPALEDA